MNQRPSSRGTWLGVAVLGLSLIPTASPAATSEQIILSLEEPRSGSVYSGVGNVRGWAVAPQGIQRIELAIDGAYRTDIPSGGLRTDVGDAYPTYPNADASGFSMAFNYSNLALGSHTLTVRAVDGRGDDRTVTATFSVTRFDNAFVNDPGSVSLNGATVRDDGKSILIDNLLVEGKRYDLRLGWRTATQGFAIAEIATSQGPNSVTGAVELASVKEISGWAYDAAAISVPARVKIFINGNSVATVQADRNLDGTDVGWDSWDYYYAFCDANRKPSCPNNIFFYKPLGWTWHSGDKVNVYATSQTGGGEKLIGSQICNIVCSNPHDITSCNLSCN